MKFKATNDPISLPELSMRVPMFFDGKRALVQVSADFEIPDLWEAVRVYRSELFVPDPEKGGVKQDPDRAALALFRSTVKRVHNYDGFEKNTKGWLDRFLSNHQRRTHAMLWGHLVWANITPEDGENPDPLAEPLNAAD